MSFKKYIISNIIIFFLSTCFTIIGIPELSFVFLIFGFNFVGLIYKEGKFSD